MQRATQSTDVNKMAELGFLSACCMKQFTARPLQRYSATEHFHMEIQNASLWVVMNIMWICGFGTMM